METFLEDDFRPTLAPPASPRMLRNSTIELLHSGPRRDPPVHALFDFDGTLSLIREGWPEVMLPMMVEVLQATGTAETPAELYRLAYQFVMQLTGKQTIYQMMRLAEEVRRRGGTPEDPLVYKQRYHDRLLERIATRREALATRQRPAADMLVPFSLELLAGLQERGVKLYLASGTDEAYVQEEVCLLGLDIYFGRHVYGAQADYKAFSKAMVIERILRENQVDGRSLLGFGDGFVEIQNIKAVDGVAVGVASDEAGRSGKPDPWKRDRLISVGADLIIPDFRDWRLLLAYLWNEIPPADAATNHPG
jgi:phosphoglycolate phosphatase-like HAD superfamily hydrolase